jgi:hypothetical protein
LIKPLLVRIFARWREIVTNFHANQHILVAFMYSIIS